MHGTRFLKRGLGMKNCLLGLFWALCACGAWAQPPVPLLWKVSDADNSVYLLGSMHLLTEADYPLASAVEAAFADSAQLVFEIAPDQPGQEHLEQTMLQAARRSDGKTLQQSLPVPTWKALQAYAQTQGMPVAALQGYKAWFVALMVMVAESQKAGVAPALGLDRHLMQRAAAAGKATAGLESAEAQIALFDGMGALAEQQFLQETLADAPRLKQQMDELLAAWRQADEATMERLGLKELRRDYPALYQSVNVARNRAWLPRVEALLRDSSHDNALVVVGALHLLGDDGLVRQLARKGYRLQRLR